MKKLAVISMFVATTGLCFVDYGTAQGSMNSQEQYGSDQSQAGTLPGKFSSIEFVAANTDGLIQTRVDYVGAPSFFSVLLLSTSSDRAAFADGALLTGARTAGIGSSQNAHAMMGLDLAGSQYEGFLWLQAVIFTSEGEVLVSDIKRIALHVPDQTDPGPGINDPDGGAVATPAPKLPGSDKNQNAGKAPGNGEQAKV